MQKNWFLVTDMISAKLAGYLSGFLLLCIFSLSIMSFRNDTETPQKINQATKIEVNSNQPVNNQIISKLLPISALSIGLNPEVRPFVKAYLDRQGDDYSRMRIWGKAYFRIYDRILSEYGIPTQLKYLSVIESDLQANLVSSADAVGPWQLMPDEAQRFHLSVRDGVDERTDFYKSTVVAAQLLKELHNEFGDWLLVVAAYNCGSGGVRHAISQAGSRDFWKIQEYLPEETRNEVKKYIATDYYFEGSAGITTMTASETKKYLQSIEKQNNTLMPWSVAVRNTAAREISPKYSENPSLTAPGWN